MKNHIYFLITAHLLITTAPCAAMHNSLNRINTFNETNSTIGHTQKKPLKPLVINTIYRNFTVTEPVLIELLHSPVMERIKHIRQAGTLDYVIKQKHTYTRYEHCVGVWALLRMYGATLEEQIAGLLHDASHTVFSHVGDVLFNHHSEQSSYQDDIHEWYLKQQNVDVLLARHNITLDSVLHKSGAHTMLEQDLPNICADRLEYNLQAGLLTDLLTHDDIATILNDLRYDNGQWFFTTTESAKKLALVSLFNTEHVWSSPANQCVYTWTAHALRRALDIELLTSDDIHFSTDPIVWDKLWISNDEIIANCLKNIVNCQEPAEEQNESAPLSGKFRGLDPFIQEDNQLKRLTTLDNEYCKEYNRIKARLAHETMLNDIDLYIL
jgi:HD superfamily phosphohydrolase